MDNEKRSFKSMRTVCPVVLAAATVAFGITWAFYSNISALANPLSTSHSGVAMVEEFNPNSSFLPGETVAKVVKFQNTGDMDLFLRVQVPPEEDWYTAQGKKNDKLSKDRVFKNWTDSWTKKTESVEYESGTETIKLQKWGDWEQTDLWSAPIKDANGNYYRYYREILKANGDSGDKDETPAILESIKLDPRVTNDRHEANYSDMIYKLTFLAEAVPVESHADMDEQMGIELWGVSVDGVANGILTWSSIN